MLMRIPRLTRMAFDRSSSADHDGWYTPTGWLRSPADLSGEAASLNVSALWRALFILSNAGVASLPCITYRKRPDGGRERASGMPIYDLLHDGPNAWQTAPEYWDFVMRALVLRGNACSLIVPGPRGAVDQLIPLHPDRLRILDLGGDRIGYRYRPGSGAGNISYTEEEIFHIRVFADGGKVGASMLTHAAADLGHAMTLARYGQRLFTKAPMLSGVLEAPGVLDDAAFNRTRKSFEEAHSGPEGWHSVALLEQGTKFSKLGMTNDDAQFLQSREFTIRDVARWTGVKKYLLESEDTPNYNSIEAFQVEHVTYAIRPWAYTIEQGISRDLIQASGFYFSEFLLDALMRGDPLKRAQTLEIQRRNGVVNADEWRELENRNVREDGEGGDYWGQPNLAASRGRESEAAREPADKAEDAREAEDAQAERNARALAIATSAADRVVRRETAALTKAAQRFAQDGVAFHAFVADFYEAHAGFVSEALGLSAEEAQRYCTGQRGRVDRDGMDGLETWAHDGPTRLAQTALMLEG